MNLHNLANLLQGNMWRQNMKLDCKVIEQSAQ